MAGWSWSSTSRTGTVRKSPSTRSCRPTASSWRSYWRTRKPRSTASASLRTSRASPCSRLPGCGLLTSGRWWTCSRTPSQPASRPSTLSTSRGTSPPPTTWSGPSSRASCSSGSSSTATTCPASSGRWMRTSCPPTSGARCPSTTAGSLPSGSSAPRPRRTQPSEAGSWQPALRPAPG